jgi:signal peptidase I
MIGMGGIADRWTIFAVALLLVAVFLMFPVAMGTKTYPIAIVEGNSMYPSLQNGDLVIFHAVSPLSITNGSIIVFVQGQTGISLLDSMIRGVVIHRVNDVIIQYDGVINFRTKGDNNQESDPELLQAPQLLGTPVQVIPKIGLIFLFIRSSQGMVAIVGFITLLYLGNYESKLSGDRRKSEFIGAFANMALNNVVSRDLFSKLEIAVKYSDELKIEEMEDDCLKKLVEWIRNDELDYEWKMEKVECPRCHSPSIKVDAGEGHSLTLCEKCEARPDKKVRLRKKIEHHMKLAHNSSNEAIDEQMMKI